MKVLQNVKFFEMRLLDKELGVSKCVPVIKSPSTFI